MFLFRFEKETHRACVDNVLKDRLKKGFTTNDDFYKVHLIFSF